MTITNTLSDLNAENHCYAGVLDHVVPSPIGNIYNTVPEPKAQGSLRRKYSNTQKNGSLL